MLAHRTSRGPWPFFVALSLLAIACNRSDSSPPTDSKASPTGEAGAACDAAHAKALEQELVSLCDLGELVSTIDAPSAPWKPSLVAPPQGAMRIDVTPEGVVVGWGAPVPVAELRGHLVEGLEMNAMLNQSKGVNGAGTWLLSMAKDTPRAQVSAVLQALVDVGQPRGYVRLTAETATPLPVPRDPKQLAELDAQLAKQDASNKAVFLAREIERAAATCPEFEEAFESVAADDPATRCHGLARSLASGIQRCGCAEESVMMTFFYALTVGSKPPVRLTTAPGVTLDAQSTTPRHGATWAEIVAGLDEPALTGLWVSAS